MLRNLSYETLFLQIGPWWYFSLAIQLYLIFPVLYGIVERRKAKGFLWLLGGGYAAIYALWPVTERLGIPMFGNFLGHIPEFAFGIYLAMDRNFSVTGKLLLAALAVFVLSCFFKVFFPLSFLSVTVLLLASCSPLLKNDSKAYVRPLVFIGRMSMFMFVINAMLRTVAIALIPPGWMSPMVIFAASLANLAAVIFASWVISLFYFPLGRFLKGRYNICI